MPLFGITMSEVAAAALGTLTCLLEVLAELGLVGVRQVLQLLLSGDTSLVHAGVELLLNKRVARVTRDTQATEAGSSTRSRKPEGRNIVAQIG